MDLRALLNDRRWHHHDFEKIEVVVVHRGMPRDRRTVPGWAITDVTPTGILLFDDTFVPFHRFLQVRLGDEVLWATRRTAP